MLLGGRLIRYFGMAVDGGLQVAVLFRLIGYNLPYFLELILPLSFFIALMLVFGRLYADSEMAVLNSAGISRGRLGQILLPVIVAFFVLEAFLSVIAKPWGVKSAEYIWQDQKALEVFDLITPKQFVSRGDYHLYVGDIGQNRAYLSDVIIIKTTPNTLNNKPNNALNNKPSQHKSDMIIIAKRAIQVADDNDRLAIELTDGKRYEFNPASRQYNQIGFGRYILTLDIAPKNIDELKVSAWTMRELINANAQNRPKATAELAYRLSLPWLVVIAVLYALPLSKTRPRQSRWGRLVPSVLIFVAIAMVLISLKKPIEKQKIGVFIYPLMTAVFVLSGLYMNYHTRLVSYKKLAKHNLDNQTNHNANHKN